VTFLSKSPGETVSYGARLGRRLKKGDVVCLYGELGSGKTVFAKGVASSLGIREKDVASASFVIIAEYSGSTDGIPLPFYHIDLYRIENSGEIDSIGLEEYVGGEGVAVIEWAERLGKRPDSISVRLKILNAEEREITIGGIDEEDWDYKQDRQT
jgi:tRNA threonylcarbamoyladenosine biosynthesis protein TsaE